METKTADLAYYMHEETETLCFQQDPLDRCKESRRSLVEAKHNSIDVLFKRLIAVSQ